MSENIQLIDWFTGLYCEYCPPHPFNAICANVGAGAGYWIK